MNRVNARSNKLHINHPSNNFKVPLMLWKIILKIVEIAKLIYSQLKCLNSFMYNFGPC